MEILNLQSNRGEGAILKLHYDVLADHHGDIVDCCLSIRTSEGGFDFNNRAQVEDLIAGLRRALAEYDREVKGQ